MIHRNILQTETAINREMNEGNNMLSSIQMVQTGIYGEDK